MSGLGLLEIVIVVFVIGAAVATWFFFVIIVARAAKSGAEAAIAQSGGPLSSPHRPVAKFVAQSDDADVQQTIIARLTQRFCPQCRSPLSADAPEGLCPACLMAGGLASSPRNATGGVPESADVNGLAVTTPPSGSQPPASGEWKDLARHFPELDIIELLGRGGMGTVYKARQKNLDRHVALKVIPPDAAKDPAFTERFNREARAMARMNHPNIVTVYDFGERDGVYFLLMEFVDGVNLRHALRAGHLAPREALAIVPQVCDALQYAHDQGVVHRDIKPENVLLDRSGRVKIADFGLAKLLGKGPDDFTLTRTQQVMGTPRYMAPEQIEKPSTVDHRADIYSLGVVLYEMLTGELPLGRFEPPSHKVEVDVRIDQVVLRALEKAPDRRYQRASEIKTELASAASWPALAAPIATPLGTAAPAVSPPIWRTPNPATKFEFWDPSQPGGVPLRYVLGVALGMVLGVLMMTAGVAAGIFGLLKFPGLSAGWWGWMGAAFGCVVGGFGSTAGSYNSYRQLTGAEDLMRSPRVTWFDWVMRGYLMLGVVLVALALAAFDRARDELSVPLTILGGVATFQGLLFLLWRMLIRPAAAAGEHLATSAERDLPAEPSYLRAVVWPTLAMAAVFGILLADVHFALPTARPQAGITQKLTAYRQWYEAIVVTALVAVPLCLVVLGVWRTWGPRHSAPDGTWTVPFPFGHRAWLWVIAGLAGLSLFLPWFRLEIPPQAEVVLRYGEVLPGELPGGHVVSVTEQADSLRTIAAIPASGRYSLRGLQSGNTAAGACLVIFAAVLSVLVFQPRHPARIGFLLVSAAFALLLVTALLHRAADQSERIVVDDTIESGLFNVAIQGRGQRPHSVEPWRHAIAPAIVAQPAFGVYALLAACGLAIFIGVTELSWGAVVPTGVHATAKSATAVPQKQIADADPARAAVLGRVAGPGIGLMIVGVLGFVPILVAVLAVPAWTVKRVASQSILRESLEFLDGRASPPMAPSGDLPVVAAPVPSGTLAVNGPLAKVPLLVAQVDSRPLASYGVGVIGLAMLLNLAFSVTLLIGGWRMRQARSYGLSVIAAIMALLPCTFGWIVGLPIGIWALVVLMDPEVKAAFES